MLLDQPPSTTIFERMSGLARETGALNLGQGFPDLDEPRELLEAARDALISHPNQYPPMRGLPALRQAIVDWYAAEQGLAIRPEEIVITSGATEALAASILALVKPGDEVILFQPLYDAYQPLVERAGGTVRLLDLVPPHWGLPLAALEEAVGPRTRLILLNTPNNPTGSMVSREELEALGAICARHDILLLCDEVWEATLLDAERHVAPFHIPALRDRSVKIGSAGKIFSLTGWKVGWAVAAPAIADAIAASHQFLTFTTATPLQHAVAEGLRLDAAWFAAHRGRYRHARDRLRTGLERAGYVVLPAAGTWFLLIDLAASGLPADDVAVAESMIREAGIASIPVSAFYAERAETGFLRLCFAKRDGTLDDAIGRLAVFRERFL